MNSLRTITATTIVAQIFLVIASSASSSLAFAANDSSIAILRQEFRSPASVAIQGPLTATTGCNANSPTCQLQVKDEKTGTSYKIQSNTWVADDARTLYQAGVKNVSIEGHITGSDTVSADTIQKTN